MAALVINTLKNHKFKSSWEIREGSNWFVLECGESFQVNYIWYASSNRKNSLHGFISMSKANTTIEHNSLINFFRCCLRKLSWEWSTDFCSCWSDYQQNATNQVNNGECSSKRVKWNVWRFFKVSKSRQEFHVTSLV